MAVLILIARVLYALIFIGSGIGQLVQTEETAEYAASRRVPAPHGMARVSGVLILLGGLGVGFGIYPDVAALGLAAFSLIGAFLVHHFWTDTDRLIQTTEMSMFMKNLAIAGGGLAIFALMSLLGTEAGLTITGPFFELSL